MTRGEAARIRRRRLGLSQVQMLRKLGMSRWAYQHLEASTERGPAMMLSDQEWCRVARWRAGKSQREVAASLGVSKLWVVKMENGAAPVNALFQFWSQQK